MCTIFDEINCFPTGRKSAHKASEIALQQMDDVTEEHNDVALTGEVKEAVLSVVANNL